MRKQLFREKALEKLASPDNIHELVQITSARSWLVLAGISFLVFAFVIWAIFGKIPKTVSGQGMLIQTGGIVEMNALGGGIVKKVLVKEGDLVKKNDTIAIIAQPETEIQINNLQKKLQNLKEKRKKFVQNNVTNKEYKKLLLEKYFLEEQIAQTEQLQKALQERIEREAQIVKEKNIINHSFIEIKRQQAEIDRINAKYDSIWYVINQKLSFLNTPEEAQIEAYDNEINENQRIFDELYAKFNISTYIKSGYEGKVVEIMAKQGQLLEAGALIASLEVENTQPQTEALQAMVYIPAQDGKKVLPKMKAKIAPSTVKVEEYGFIEGEVISVSEYPSTKQGMMRILSNADLVEAFSKGSPPIAVKIKLYTNPQTFSKYKWTSKAGPPIKIRSGTLCEAHIVVYQQTPITLLFPFLKENINL
ncbi:MAG: NHLP bacteriocin system secretion protein [Microscillaceae bacterium]|nr:NHLP bacteriocin system secretion protein [Microscillaceae bacterium]MDW8461777.1 NHLP bacteriocin system secretion protein [Cytophagales bacterium]